MNAAVTQRRNELWLPEINPNNKRRRTTQHGGTKQEKDIPQTGQSTQIPSKVEIAQFRQSLKQNICVELLQQGYHRSFSEFFFLLTCDEARREAAEPGSDLKLQSPLGGQHHKLEPMREHLSWAERAEKTGSWTVVCEQRLTLGKFFSCPEDLWLSLHFYHSCSDRELGGQSRPATEARACMAELYLQQGDLEQAKQQAELCMRMAEDGSWLDSDRRPLKLRARRALWRVYSRLAQAPLEEGDAEQGLKLLHKGHCMARQSQDKQIEGEACHLLGLTYQSTGDHTTALKFFNQYLQICSALGDADGLGKSYKAMAKSLESEGDPQKTVQCLEMLVDVLRKHELYHNLSDAFLCLGNNYYNRGEYDRACEFFLQGYDVACNLGDVTLLQKAQVMVSSARAHSLIRKYSEDVECSSHDALSRLVDWKETRGRADATDHSQPAWC